MQQLPLSSLNLEESVLNNCSLSNKASQNTYIIENSNYSTVNSTSSGQEVKLISLICIFPSHMRDVKNDILVEVLNLQLNC